MDPDELRDAQTRLERDYLAGAFSADEYTRLRRQLHESGATQSADDSVPEVRLAGWGRRAAAVILDWLVLFVVIVGTSVWAFATTNPITDELADAAALLLVLEILFLPSLYQWLMVGQWGQTLGKMALGERVVRAEDAGRVGYARAAGRVASAWLLGIFVLPLLLAYLWPLWDKRNQT
ncbi:MAG: RDD family protein, partial [Gaiellaceae bacterium]